MLTGIVKLAQIDDYIAPSQNCIQPKIMKKDAKEEKATVTLNDCLACSGCITSAESVLIEQMSVKKFMELGTGDCEVTVMVSPQSLLSLAKYYGMELTACLDVLSQFFRKNFKSFKAIHEMSLAIQICHQLILQQFLQRQQTKTTPVLCSECPGWVCYSQKTLTQKITSLMSTIKSPQQIMSHLLRHKYGAGCKVVSIMPCYDKKLEAIRFENEDKMKQVDLTLATIEIVELVKLTCGQQQFKHIKTQQSQLQTEPTLRFIKDQSSNGYIQFILERLSISEYRTEQHKNSDYKQYSFEWQGSKCKMAKCYGFRNIQKVVQMIKKDKCPYLYVEVMACPGGCFGGGGQIRYEGVKNKEIFGEFADAITKYGAISGKDGKIDVEKYGIDADKVQAKYKPIEKNLMQSVLNW